MQQINKSKSRLAPKNKVAVVTGSANGLGKALAIEFKRQGYDLALIDINLDGLENLRSELNNEYQKITIHRADISKEQEIISIRQRIIDQHGRIDIFVNNAGISISKYFDQVDLADYRSLMDVNFWGTIYCARHFLSDLKQQRDSRIVNIISEFALLGFPGKTAYCSSKGAIMGFTNSLKTELAGTAVKVCLVIPPPLDTGLVKNNLHISEIKKQKEADFLRKYGMSLDNAARRIVSKIRIGKYRIVVGPMTFWIDLVTRIFPTSIHALIGKNKKRIEFI